MRRSYQIRVDVVVVDIRPQFRVVRPTVERQLVGTFVQTNYFDFVFCSGVMRRLVNTSRIRKTCSKRHSLPPNKHGGFVATQRHVSCDVMPSSRMVRVGVRVIRVGVRVRMVSGSR